MADAVEVDEYRTEDEKPRRENCTQDLNCNSRLLNMTNSFKNDKLHGKVISWSAG